VPELIQAIDGYIAHHNTSSKPFIWTKIARDILQKIIRATLATHPGCKDANGYRLAG